MTFAGSLGLCGIGRNFAAGKRARAARLCRENGNPTQSEAMTMNCRAGLGNGAAISFAGSRNFRLKMSADPAVITASVRLLRDASSALSGYCIDGIELLNRRKSTDTKRFADEAAHEKQKCCLVLFP